MRRRALAIAGLAVLVASCETATLAPVAGTAQRFLVFFERDDAVLSDEAHTVIDQAASEARAAGLQVVVYGFADRLGDPAVNVQLSRQRASVVAEALMAEGVPPSLVTARGLGETSTIAPPSDANPEGRRAEIVLVR